jgi:hypothetical protein
MMATDENLADSMDLHLQKLLQTSHVPQNEGKTLKQITY